MIRFINKPIIIFLNIFFLACSSTNILTVIESKESEILSLKGKRKISGMSDGKKNAKASEHIYKSDDGNVSFWFGVIDDI